MCNMSPEGESIKPDDDDADGEDLSLDKTEGNETAERKNEDEDA
jgi:hypothetical protein